MAEATATQTQVGHASEEPVFPPFETATFPSQLLWLAISFGLLYLVMSRLALPRISKTIADRKAQLAKDIDDAAAMQQQADAAAAAHDKTLADARAKAQASAQAARDKLGVESAGKRQSLEDQLAAKLSAAEQQIAATRAQAMTNVGQIAQDATGAIVERLLGRSVDGGAVAQAVAAAGKN